MAQEAAAEPELVHRAGASVLLLAGAEVGADRLAAAQHVHADAGAFQLQPQRARRLLDAGVGRRVRQVERPWLHRGQRGDEEDVAASAIASQRLDAAPRHVERADELGRDLDLDLLRREVVERSVAGGRGVVDHRGHRAEPVLGRGEEPLDGLGVGDVELVGEAGAARRRRRARRSPSAGRLAARRRRPASPARRTSSRWLDRSRFPLRRSPRHAGVGHRAPSFGEPTCAGAASVIVHESIAQVPTQSRGWSGGARRLSEGVRRLARRARRRAGARLRGGRHARRADGADRQGPPPDLRRGMGPLRLAGAGRRPRGFHAVAGVPQRGVDRQRPRLFRRLLVARGARPVVRDLRAARPLGGDDPAAAARRRGVVPGVLRAGNGQQPRLPHVPGGGRRRRVAGDRPEGVDEPGAVLRSGACSSRGPERIESAHRGITALFVDMDTPGITAQPIETMHGEPEFCETFFDDVLVPFDRTLGKEGDGWAFAMDLLPYERSTALWQRAAFLHRRLQDLLDVAEPSLVDPAKLGEVVQLVYAFRSRSRATQHRQGERRIARRGDVDRQGAPGHRGTGRLRSRGRGVARRGHARRRRRERTLALGVPLLAGGDHLRRHQPRSSATSSPAGCSTWGTTDDRRARSRAVRAQPAQRDGAAHRRGARRRAGGVGLARRALVRSASRGVAVVRAPG